MNDYILINTVQDYEDMIQYLMSSDVLYLDTETTGLDPYSAKLLLLQISGGAQVFIVDFTVLPISELVKMKELLTTKKVVIHNATFDWKIIYHNSGIEMKNMHCSLVAEQVLTAGLMLGCSLDDVAFRRCDVQLNKDDRKYFIHYNGVLPEEAYIYSSQDVHVLPEIYRQQMQEIYDQNLVQVYDIEMPLLSITARMEYIGFNFNKEHMEKARIIFSSMLKRADNELQNIIIKNGITNQIVFTRDGYRAINISSSDQMQKVFGTFGINVSSTNNKELTDWDNNWASSKNKYIGLIIDDEDDDFKIGFSHPFLRLRAIRNSIRKIQSDYGEGLYNRINPVTGKIHCNLLQCGASSTGRYSARTPNLQNMIRSSGMAALGLGEYNIRSMFIPSRQDRKLVITDLSGIEAVILGALSKDENLLKYLQGDIHTYVASNIFKYEVSKKNASAKVEPDATLRQIAKNITYAIMYGTSGWNLFRSFAKDLAAVGFHITIKDADDWIVLWKSLFPNAGKILDENSQYAVTRRYVTTVAGRRRNWNPALLNTKGAINAAMREGSNAPIQGSSADILKQSLLLLNERMDHSKSDILLCVHDEIISEADDDYAEELLELTKQCFSDAGIILFPALPRGYIRGEGDISHCYNK